MSPILTTMMRPRLVASLDTRTPRRSARADRARRAAATTNPQLTQAETVQVNSLKWLCSEENWMPSVFSLFGIALCCLSFHTITRKLSSLNKNCRCLFLKDHISLHTRTTRTRVTRRAAAGCRCGLLAITPEPPRVRSKHHIHHRKRDRFFLTGTQTSPCRLVVLMTSNLLGFSSTCSRCEDSLCFVVRVTPPPPITIPNQISSGASTKGNQTPNR